MAKATKTKKKPAAKTKKAAPKKAKAPAKKKAAPTKAKKAAPKKAAPKKKAAPAKTKKAAPKKAKAPAKKKETKPKKVAKPSKATVKALSTQKLPNIRTSLMAQTSALADAGGLPQNVQRLVDKEEIKDILYRLARGIDRIDETI